MLQRLALFVCLALTAKSSWAQPQVDSLTRIVRHGNATPARIDALNELAYYYFDLSDSIATSYAHQAFELSSSARYGRGLKRAATLVGLGHASRGERAEAIRFFRLSDKTVAVDALPLTAYNRMLWGITYMEMAEFDSAWMILQAARKAARRSPADLQAVYKNMASLLLRQWKNEQALVYLDSAQRLTSVRDRYMDTEIQSHFALAYHQLARMDAARAAIANLCAGAEQSKAYYHMIECQLHLARMEMAQGRFGEALDLALAALNKTTPYNQAQYVEALILTGEAYMEVSQLALTGQYLFQALRISEAGQLHQKAATIYNDLAWLNKIDGKLEDALMYADKASVLFTKMGDRHGLSESHNVRGLTYMLQKRYPEARVEFDRALQIRREFSDSRGISATLFNISEWLIELQRAPEALPLLREVADLEEFVGNQPYLSMTYGLMSRILIQDKKFEAARALLERADQAQQKSNSLFIARDNGSHWVAYYEARGDYRKALGYHQQYDSINEEIFSQENAKKLAEYETLYKVASREREIKWLSEKQRLQTEQLQQAKEQLATRNLVIVAVGIALGLLVLLIYRIRANVRQQQQTHEKLLQLNQEVSARNQDIERNLASIETLQADLTRSEANYRGLVERASDIILEVDRLGHVTYINPAVSRVTGYLKEELLQTHYAALIHPDYVRSVKAFLHHKILIRDEHVYLEFPMLARSGESVWIGQSTHFFYEDNRLAKTVVVARDISRQKKTEDELVASRQAYEELVTAIPIGIYRTHMTPDRALRFLYVSPRWCEMNAVAADSIYKDAERARALVHPDDTPRFQAAERRALETLHFEWEGRLMIHGQGRYFRIESRGQRQPDGSMISHGYQKDIHQRKQAETEVIKAKEEAEQASSAKTEFLSNMTHEMLTPLNGIIGFSDLLLKSGLTSVQSKYQRAVTGSAQNLLDLVYDVLEFSKIEGGEVDLRADTVVIDSFFSTMLELARHQATEKGIELRLTFSGRLPVKITCDEWRLRQVVINLLSNALKFTAEGTVELHVSGEGPSVRVAVRDTGIGIAPDMQDRIFEAFVQGDFTTTKRFGGAGLGLTITQRLLALMGSHLQFSSEPGKGSEFYFHLAV